MSKTNSEELQKKFLLPNWDIAYFDENYKLKKER